MAESFISLLPSQSPAKTLPYETLWRAYYESLDNKGRQKFGSANVLEQTRTILGALNSDKGNGLIKIASELVNDQAMKDNTKIRADIDQMNQADLNMLREGARQSLVNRAQALSTMSAKALDAQKIKETMGVGNLTDEEYLDWLEGKPLYRAGTEYRTARGERYSIPEKMDAQAGYNRKMMRTPENLKGDYNQSGFNYLINKKDYYDPENWPQRAVDKALSIIPIFPFASQAAIARQQGEIGQYDTGLSNPGVVIGGSLNALALPAMYLPYGPAIAGGFAALGNSIAKGKKGGDIDALKNYATDAAIGAGTGAATGFGTNFIAKKVPFLSGLSPKAAAENEVIKAEEAYRKLMAPMLNGKTLSESEMAAVENAANREYTNRINQAMQSGQLSGVDVNAFDPNRSGSKYIVIPSEVWKNEAKLNETNEAIKAAKARTDRLKRINQYQNVGEASQWIPAELDEGGYNPVIQKAREMANYKEAPIDFSQVLLNTPTTTREMIASKPIYPFSNTDPKTFSQSVLKALGYDKAGKGAQKLSSTAPQFDVNLQIMKNIPQKDLQQFIKQNYSGSPKAMARDIVDEADSYVQEAFNLQNTGNLTADRLKSLADEYVSWNAKTPEQAEYYTREFIAKLNQLRRNPEKVPFERKPYTTIPAQRNQGGDLKGIPGVERPNPTLAAEAEGKSVSTKLEEFAKDIAKQNGRDVPIGADWDQALAYYADLENPSKGAVDKAISRADAWKTGQVTESFNKMKDLYKIPTADEAAKAEYAIINAKSNLADAGKIRNFKKALTSDVSTPHFVNPFGLTPSMATYYNEALSAPEQATFDEERANETSASTGRLTSRIPILRTLLYLDEAKKRGNFVPESNLNYTVPDILKAR